jgi:hypothetical protein
MKKKSLILMLTLIVLGAASAQAQGVVNIGSTDAPRDAAVLDLGQVSAQNLGLKLPAVDLSSVLVSGLGNSEAGLLVYNTYDTDPWTKGLYVWSGTTWVPAEQKPVLAVEVEPLTDFTVTPTLTVSSSAETVTISAWTPGTASYQGVTWEIISGGDKLAIDARSLTSITVSKITTGTAILRATSVDGRVIHDIAVTVI